MQTEIYYGDISRTENLENFLRETVEAVAEEFLRNDRGAHLTVRVETPKPRTENRHPIYTCEVILKTSSGRNVIIVKKMDYSFKTAVAKVVSALKGGLAKRSDIRTTRRKKESRRSINARRLYELEQFNNQEVA